MAKFSEDPLSFAEEVANQGKREGECSLEPESVDCVSLAAACRDLKKENEALKKEHAYTRDLLLAIAADTHPTLPITVTHEGEVVHFYTEVGGYHMSAGFMSRTIYLALHEGKFDKVTKLTSYPQIHFNQSDQVEMFSKTHPNNFLVLLFSPGNPIIDPPEGIISGNYSNTNYPITFEISLPEPNELHVRDMPIVYE